MAEGEGRDGDELVHGWQTVELAVDGPVLANELGAGRPSGRRRTRCAR